MDVKSIKTLGGLGALFLVLSWLPYLGFLLAIVGLVLLAIALKKVSDAAPERGIFTNFIIAFLVNFVGGLIAMFGGLFSMLPFMAGDENTMAIGIGLGTIVAFVIGYIAFVASGYYYKKCFTDTGDVLNQPLFKTAGNVIFWGSVAGIIIIGFLVVWIGWILVTVAFFTLPDRPAYQSQNDLYNQPPSNPQQPEQLSSNNQQ